MFSRELVICSCAVSRLLSYVRSAALAVLLSFSKVQCNLLFRDVFITEDPSPGNKPHAVSVTTISRWSPFFHYFNGSSDTSSALFHDSSPTDHCAHRLLSMP